MHVLLQYAQYSMHSTLVWMQLVVRVWQYPYQSTSSYYAYQLASINRCKLSYHGMIRACSIEFRSILCIVCKRARISPVGVCIYIYIYIYNARYSMLIVVWIAENYAYYYLASLVVVLLLVCMLRILLHIRALNKVLTKMHTMHSSY